MNVLQSIWKRIPFLYCCRVSNDVDNNEGDDDDDGVDNVDDSDISDVL